MAVTPTAAKSYPAMPVITLERVDGLHRLLPAQELEQRAERCGTLIWPQDVDRAAILYTLAPQPSKPLRGVSHATARSRRLRWEAGSDDCWH